MAYLWSSDIKLKKVGKITLKPWMLWLKILKGLKEKTLLKF